MVVSRFRGTAWIRHEQTEEIYQFILLLMVFNESEIFPFEDKRIRGQSPFIF